MLDLLINPPQGPQGAPQDTLEAMEAWTMDNDQILAMIDDVALISAELGFAPDTHWAHVARTEGLMDLCGWHVSRGAGDGHVSVTYSGKDRKVTVSSHEGPGQDLFSAADDDRVKRMIGAAFLAGIEIIDGGEFVY